MSTIIPYEPKVLTPNGAWINKDGHILLFKDFHEIYAQIFCFGFPIRNVNLDKYLNNQISFENYQGKLNKSELELFIYWLQEYHKNGFDMVGAASDFMLYVLQYDKVEALKRDTITTTSLIPHVRFYNYYLMDFDIYLKPKKTYNQEIETFEPLRYLMPVSADIEAEEELIEIKSKVKKQDRHLFFK